MKVMKKAVSLLLVAIMLFSMLSTFVITSSAATPLTHLVQTESKWRYKIGGGTLYDTGCGIFSMRNAIGYLTGYDIGIDAPARWAHSIGAYNVTGGEGTYRLVLYPKITAKYGSKAGFKVINESTWAGASSTTLKAHLANGGVAIGHVPGHFIALVDYNYNTNKFHVLDSAPSTARGTTSGYGDCWVTQSRLSTGKLKLDWFCLLSATGTPADEQNNELDNAKKALGAAITKADSLRYNNFTATSIETFRTAYTNAVSVYNNSASTIANYNTAKTNLESAMNAGGTSIISKGCSYTSNIVAHTNFPDGSKKLTDGTKSTTSVATHNGTYAAYYHTGDVEITVDLGSSKSSNLYTAYVASDFWGISVPNTMKISYSDSASGPFTSVNGTLSVKNVGNGDLIDGVSNSLLSSMTITADAPITARYIKFTLNVNSYVWLDEIQVSSGDAPLSDGIYLTGANSRIESGDCHIYTSGFGEITVSKANHAFTVNAIAEHNGDGTFTIKSVELGKGVNAPSITLTDNQILIASHNWETGVTDGSQVVGSEENTNRLNGLKAGDVVTLDGVKISDAIYFSGAPYIKIISRVGGGNETPEPEHVHTPGEEATCTRGQICLGCGEVLKEAEGHDNGIWGIEENMKVRACTKCGEILEKEELVIDGVGTTKYVLGDINDDGEIGVKDYLMLKAACLGNYELSEVGSLAGDLNGNEKIDATDYFFLKSVCLGNREI